MATTLIKSGQYDGLETESDDRLELLFKQELATLEHEELVVSQEQVEDLLLHRPSAIFQKAISVLAEIVVMKSQASPLGRMRELAGQGFLTIDQAQDISRYLTNEQVAKVIQLMSQLLIELRKRSDVVVPE